MRYIIGIFSFITGLILLLTLRSGLSGLSYLIEFPTFFGFLIVIIAVILVTGEFRVFIAALNAILSKSYSISAADREKAIKLFKLLGRSIVYASVLFATTGVMQLLSNLDDLSTFGPALAITLLSITYGAFINLIFVYPAISILEVRYNTEEKTVISEKQVIDKLLELCYKQGISPEEIVNANEISFKKD